MSNHVSIFALRFSICNIVVVISPHLRIHGVYKHNTINWKACSIQKKPKVDYVGKAIRNNTKYKNHNC